MTPAELLTEAFSRVPETVERAVDGLSTEQLATRPAAGANTLAWLAWHTARGQDAQVADLAGTEQAWTADGWVERFGLPFPADALGYGMSSEDVGRVRASAELLTAYLRAVHERTVAYLGTLAPEDLDEVVDDAWDPPVTRGARLVSILDDCTQHAGQAGYVRGLLFFSR
ncbi:chorismate synthase [Curtobacterium oceanosedimentum]|uniref:Chorismate synthase n=1 Tax=Curtobacterium oceanosedimentum TaxID=465820 RepID=A0ABR5S8J1_9MICO|nr:DinB family protein [Curtobacterium oceanosedimentum]KTR40780.1 chorismate synthase [Curtobacterium oceanosedimentum]